MAVFSEGLGRIIARDDVSLKTLGAETASTTASAVELGDKATMSLEVYVSLVSGTTPTMIVTIEGSHDNSNWFTLGRIGLNGFDVGGLATAPSNITAAGTYRGEIPAARFVRSKSTIGGTTPSFTYSVGGTAT
jgi:hypothetical protein